MANLDKLDRFTQDYVKSREDTKHNPVPPYQAVSSDMFCGPPGENDWNAGTFQTFEEAVLEARKIFDPLRGRMTIGEIGLVYDSSGWLVWSGNMEQGLPPALQDRTARVDAPKVRPSDTPKNRNQASGPIGEVGKRMCLNNFKIWAIGKVLLVFKKKKKDFKSKFYIEALIEDRDKNDQQIKRWVRMRSLNGPPYAFDAEEEAIQMRDKCSEGAGVEVRIIKTEI